MSEEYSIIEQARDARKVSWVYLHCGCSVVDAALNVLDNPRRFLRAWNKSLQKLETELDSIYGE